MNDQADLRPGFWNRDFVVGLLGYLFLFMSVSLFFLLPLFLGRFGPSKGRVGLIMGIHSVLAIMVRPFFGREIDHKGGRKIALAGIAIMMAGTPLFHLVKDAGAFPLLLRAVTGVGWGISMTATISICSDLAPASSMARSMGIIGVAGLIANALGPLAAEEIIRRWGYGALFNVAFLFLAASLVCVFLVREAPRICALKRPEAGFLKTVPVWALVIIAAMPVFHGAVRGTMIYFIALFGKTIGVDRIGPFFLVFSVAAIMTRFGLGDLSDRRGRKRVIFVSAAVISLNLFVISQARGFWTLVATGFVGGLGQGLIFPALSTYLIDFMGRENKGLAISLYLALFDVGMGIGAPMFGGISDLFGYRVMYFFAGVLLLAATLVFMAKAPRTETDRLGRGGEGLSGRLPV
jgi:MFS family permease